MSFMHNAVAETMRRYGITAQEAARVLSHEHIVYDGRAIVPTAARWRQAFDEVRKVNQIAAQILRQLARVRFARCCVTVPGLCCVPAMTNGKEAQ